MYPRFFIILAVLLSINISGQEKLVNIYYEDVFNEADLAIEKNDYKKTVEILGKINKNDSTYSAATVSKTYYLLQNEDFENVIKLCDNHINDFEGDDQLSLYINKGVALESLEKYNESLAIYNEALKKYPKYFLLWYNKGTVLSSLKKYNEALKAFQKANRYNPFYKETHLQVGDIYFKNGKTAQALMCYNIYAILNIDSEYSNEVFLALNAIASKSNPNKSTAFQENNELYEEIDLIVKSNMALSKDYKIGNEFVFPLIKQNHAILEKVSEVEEDTSHFGKKYLAIHKWIKENDYFNSYTYAILYGVKNKKFQKKVAKNKNEVVAFFRAFNNKWLELNSVYKTTINGVEKDYNYIYSESNVIEAIGSVEDGKKTGTWNIYNDSGQLSLQAFFNKDGKKDKEWKWYYPDGSIKEITNYTNDEFDGATDILYENGKKYVEAAYKSGKFEGDYKYYNKKGALLQHRVYKEGLLEDTYKAYFPVGEKALEFNIPYKNNVREGLFTEYYANGDVYYEVNYKEGKKEGVEKTYYLDKVLMKEVEYVDGKMNGFFKYYSSKGILLEEGATKDDLYVGEWKLYFEDGTFNKQYNYENGYIEGVAKFYDRDKKLHYEYEYKKGEVIAYKYFNKKGEVIKEGRKKRGAFFFESYSPLGIKLSKGNYDVKGGKEGLWEFYNTNGALKTQSNYVANNLEGTSTGYYEDGTVKFKCNYKDNNLEGYYVGYHNNGQIEYQGYYRNGLAEGEWIYYYGNGATESINFYHKNNLHGEQKYFTTTNKLSSTATYVYGDIEEEVIYDVNGAVFQTIDFKLKKGNSKVIYKHYNNKTDKIINYENGVKHGAYTTFDFYGNKRIEGGYVNNALHGEWKWYYKDGKIESVRNYRVGGLYGKSIDNFKNGALNGEENYYKDKREGADITYFENGNVDRKSTYVNGEYHGKRSFYAVTGELQLHRFYNHGRLIGYSYLDTNGKEIDMIPIENESGKVKAFYQNGQVSREMEIDKGNFLNEYKVYYPDGTLENITKYNKSGELSGLEKEFFPNGKVKREMPYVSGKLSGVYKEYYKNGQLKIEKTYIHGDLNGVTRNYDKTGKLLNEEKYFNDKIYEVVKK